MIEVIDFFSNSCQPCKQIMKILPRLEQQIRGKGFVTKICIDDDKESGSVYQIQKVPTFVILKDGKEVKRFEGVVPLAEIGAAVMELAEG